MRFRKKPVEIEAMRWDGSSYEDVIKWANNASDGNGTTIRFDSVLGLSVRTLEGEMFVITGDWIICGIKGEFYPCKPDIFEMTYEKID